jgi:hypothetical protein
MKKKVKLEIIIICRSEGINVEVLEIIFPYIDTCITYLICYIFIVLVS